MTTTAGPTRTATPVPLRSTQPTFAVTTGDLDHLSYRSGQQYVRDVETAGFRMLWLSEVAGREAFTCAQLALAGSDTITVGNGVARALERAPKNAAAAQWSLSEGFPGRYVLGLGVSGAVRARGVGPVEFMSTYLDDIDEHLDRVAPTLATRRILGAYSTGLTRLAAERADGVLTFLVTPDHTHWARSVLGPDPFLSVGQWVVVDSDRVQARTTVRRELAYYLSLPHQQNKLRRLGFDDRDLAPPGSDRLVDALAYHGEPAEIAQALQQHVAAGADQVAISVLGPPDDAKRDGYVALAAALGADRLRRGTDMT